MPNGQYVTGRSQGKDKRRSKWLSLLDGPARVRNESFRNRQAGPRVCLATLFPHLWRPSLAYCPILVGPNIYIAPAHLAAWEVSVCFGRQDLDVLYSIQLVRENHFHNFCLLTDNSNWLPLSGSLSGVRDNRTNTVVVYFPLRSATFKVATMFLS